MPLPITQKLSCVWPDGTVPPVVPPTYLDLRYAIGSSIRFQIDNYWSNGTARDVSGASGRLVVSPGYGVPSLLDVPWTVDVNVPSRAYVDIWSADLQGTDPATYKAQIAGRSGGVLIPLGPIGLFSAEEFLGFTPVIPDPLVRPIATLLVLMDAESSKQVVFDAALDTADYVVDAEIALDASGGGPSLVGFATSNVDQNGFLLSTTADFTGLVRITIYPHGTTAFPPLFEGSRILDKGLTTFNGEDTLNVTIATLPYDDYEVHIVPLLDSSGSPSVIPSFTVPAQTKKQFTLAASAPYVGVIHWSLHEALA